MFWSLIFWGLLSAAMGLINNIWLLYVDRFLLGVAESAVLPGMIVLLSHWFTRPERSRANNMVILGAPITLLYMSVLSGYLIQYFGWRGMFVIEGLPAVIVAFVWLRLVDDQPRQATWPLMDERNALEAALREEQRDIRPMRNYAEAFCSPVVLLLLVQNFCWVGGVLGFLMWLPTILKQGSTFSMVGVRRRLRRSTPWQRRSRASAIRSCPTAAATASHSFGPICCLVRRRFMGRISWAPRITGSAMRC